MNKLIGGLAALLVAVGIYGLAYPAPTRTYDMYFLADGVEAQVDATSIEARGGCAVIYKRGTLLLRGPEYATLCNVPIVIRENQ